MSITMKRVTLLSVICCLYLNGATGASGSVSDTSPSIVKPGIIAGKDVSGVNLPAPSQSCGNNETCQGYDACYQILLIYLEGIQVCKSIYFNREASIPKWTSNAHTIFSYAKIAQIYYNETKGLIQKNENHVIIFAISKLSVIFCQWVLYAVVEIFKASLKSIVIETMVQAFTSVLTWVEFGYSTISGFVGLNFLIELMGNVVDLSVTFSYKYYYYSSISCPTAVSATTLFSETIYFLQKMNYVWYAYVRAFQGLPPAFLIIAKLFINVIQILYDVVFSFVLQPKKFIGLSTTDFYNATSYLNEVQSGLAANPGVLTNGPAKYKAIYCFLEYDEIYQLTVFIGKLVATYKGKPNTFILVKAYIIFKESVNRVNKYCIQYK